MECEATGLRRSAPLIALILGAVGLRLVLSPLYAHLPNGVVDERFWTAWMAAIQSHGVLNVFRSTDANYLGYQWILWLLSLAYGWMGGSYEAPGPSLHVLVKLPPVFFDALL